jgi:hypothetical protein
VSYLEKGPTELFAPLDAEPDAPSRVDIAAAMATGRRHKRGRAAAVGAAVVALAGGTAIGGTLAFSGAAPDPLPDCFAIPLPMGTETSIDVTGTDPYGRYIAGRADPVAGQKSSVVVWHDNKIVDVLRRPGVVLSDFTSRGVGVGHEVDGRHAYVYRDGKLSTLDGEQAAAFAVDESGVIVGKVADRPARWASPTAEPAPLPLPAGANRGAATMIADDGTIFGLVEGDTMYSRSGYSWRPDGTHGPLAPPMVDGERAHWFEPESIRDGWIYGEMTMPGGRVIVGTGPSAGTDAGIGPTIKHLAFRYEVSTGRWDRLPEDVGTSGAYFYLGDRVVPLPLDPAADETAYYYADIVGDGGRFVVGDRSGPSIGPFRPVSWRCE